MLALIIIAIVIITAYVFISILYIHDRYSLLYYGDAVSHLFGARRLVDWEHPGLQQLGTVWLPLPELLFLLPSLIDVLFFTGLAGSIVNLSALTLTTYAIYSTLKDTKRSSRLPLLLLSLLYPLNLNVLYLSSVAMTEACFILFFTASAFYLYRFMKDCRERHIMLSASFIALATLTRYEGWALTLFLIAYIIVIMVRNIISKSANARPIILVSMLIAVSGILSWLLYNHYTYGDALEFANAQYYSASWQAMHRGFKEVLFLQPLNVIKTYGITALIFYGPLMVYASTLPFIMRPHRMLLYLYLALPAIVSITSMIVGVGEMGFWFNSRFAIFIAPLLIILTADSINDRSNTKGNMLIILALAYQLVLIPIIHYYSSSDASTINTLINSMIGKDRIGIITYIDAKDGFMDSKMQTSVRVGEFLRDNYASKVMHCMRIMVIADSMQEHRIILSSWIRLSIYDEVIDSSTWKDSFKRPWLYNDIIVIGKYNESDAVNVSGYWLDRLNTLLKFYDKVYEDEYYILLEAKQRDRCSTL